VVAFMLALLVLPVRAADQQVRWDNPADRDWIEVRSEHFRVFSDAGENRARELASQLELFRTALGQFTRGMELDTSVPTVMFAFRRDRHYEPYKLDENGLPMNVAGYFQPTPFKNFITLDASSGWGTMRVVFQEYFHAVIQETLGDLPLWLNEGLAEYYSTFQATGFDTRVELGHHIDDHLQYLKHVARLPWDDVFSTTPSSPSYNEGTRQGAFYAQSWLLVHYLTSFEDGAKGLGRYLTALKTGADPLDSFEEELGINRADLIAGADRYAEQTIFPYRTWKLGDDETVAALTVREMESSEILYHLGDLLAHRGQTEAARRHLDLARAAGRPQRDIDAAFGFAAYRNGDVETAMPLLRAAIGAGIEDPEPYVLVAEIVLDDYFVTGTAPLKGVPEDVEDARTLLETALDHDPDNFPAQLTLARSYLVGPDAKPGVAAIVRARQERPIDLDMTELHACLLARAGYPREAWAMIRDQIEGRDPGVARNASECAAHGVLDAARIRVLRDERDEASALLAVALEDVGDIAEAGSLRSLKDAIDSGAEIHFTAAKADDDITRFNQAVVQANRGQHEAALEVLRDLAENASDARTKQEAQRVVDSLSEMVERNRWIGEYNRAVALANDFKRKPAVELLRQLHETAPDDAARTAVEDLLRALGAKIKKKK
jgi:tetratricopeptide (TPR) repeat protein